VPFALRYVGQTLSIAWFDIEDGDVLRWRKTDSHYHWASKDEAIGPIGPYSRDTNEGGQQGNIQRIVLRVGSVGAVIVDSLSGYDYAMHTAQVGTGDGLRLGSYTPVSGNVSQSSRVDTAQNDEIAGARSWVRWLDIEAARVGLIAYDVQGVLHQTWNYSWTFDETNSATPPADAGQLVEETGAKGSVAAIVRGSLDIDVASQSFVDDTASSTTAMQYQLVTPTQFTGPPSPWPAEYDDPPGAAFYNPVQDVLYPGGAVGYAKDARQPVAIWFDRFAATIDPSATQTAFWVRWSDPGGLDPFERSDPSEPLSIMPAGIF